MNQKILLVEDDTITAQYEIKELESHGYKVIHVDNGNSAIKTAVSNNHIGLILMDIDLGEGIDGPTTAERILNNLDLPIVFLSGHTEPEVVEKTEKITSYGYVVKNSGIIVLDASIKMALKLHKAKKMLKERELFLSSIFHAVPSGIGIVVNRVITYVNQQICEITGYSKKELIGNTARMLYPSEEEYNKVGKLKYEQIEKNGTGSVHTKWVHKDGKLLTIFLSSTPIDRTDLTHGVTFTALDMDTMNSYKE